MRETLGIVNELGTSHFKLACDLQLSLQLEV
jgi:hypothetical protein